MTLKEYLKKNKITGKEFAKMVGVGHDHIYLITKGYRMPGVALQRLIYILTEGMVTSDDFTLRNENEGDSND